MTARRMVDGVWSMKLPSLSVALYGAGGQAYGPK
jgi:hypothetical protein